MARNLSLTLVAVVALAAPARAQSKRYPPVPPDKELEDEQRSQVWDATLHPDRSPYKLLVTDAQHLIDRNPASADDIKAALDKLDSAIKLRPKVADAFVVRGRLHAKQLQWTECADDLGRAEDYTKTDAIARIELGQCQARAGRLADAERTLVRAAVNNQTFGNEPYRSLGEVRIALGKLDEAIDALANVADNDAASRWLLALAYDRARRTNDAQQATLEAKKVDQGLYSIMNAHPALLGAGDKDYLYGLANRWALGRPDHALLYFRTFLKAVPANSPWRRRAEEHLRELSKLKMPPRETLSVTGSTTADLDKLHAALVTKMPAMRACMAKLPSTIIQVGVTKVGPHSPDTRDRPIYRVPPAGVEVRLLTTFGDAPAEPLALEAQRCIEKHANATALPSPKEHDSYYKVYFNVVSP